MISHDIASFDKCALRPARTIVTDRNGRQFVEGEGEIFTTNATLIISEQVDSEESHSGEETMPFDYHIEESSASEIGKRARWLQKRTIVGDGFICGTKSPLVCIFVEEKSMNERHFDKLAFLLHEWCTLKQIDHEDVIAGELQNPEVKAIIFPGGAIHSVHKAIGEDGAKEVASFVHNGGGYVGICAGAFLATGKGYTGAIEGWQLLHVDTSWFPGTGNASVACNQENWLHPNSESVGLYFANGPMFKVKESCKTSKNTLINMKTTSPKVIARYTDLITDQKSPSQAHITNYSAAIITGEFGSGTVICFGPHPEASGSAWTSSFVRAVLSVCKQ